MRDETPGTPSPVTGPSFSFFKMNVEECEGEMNVDDVSKRNSGKVVSHVLVKE